MECRLCPRMCGAERSEYEGRGVCRMGTLPRLARCAPHYDEEPCISGRTGTGAVFFSGCTLKCAFCQNWSVSHEGFGETVSPARLREIYFELIDKGVTSVSLISGTQFIPAIIESLDGGLPVPVVWNSSGYERVESLKMLEGLVDVYLPDFKYMDPLLAERLSGARDYPDVALKAIEEMLRQTGSAVYGEDGLMKKGTLIRHLVLPNHAENTLMVLRRIKWDFEGAPVSLMSQYVPMGGAGKFPDISRWLTKEEYDAAAEAFDRLDLEGYTQELDSAQTAYTPLFDLTGVKKEAT